MLQNGLKAQSRKWTLQEYDSDEDEVDQLTIHEAFQYLNQTYVDECAKNTIGINNKKCFPKIFWTFFKPTITLLFFPSTTTANKNIGVMLFEEPKTQAELDEEKKEKEEKEKLEKDKLKLSHTQKVKQTKTQISVIRKINPKMKKEDMLLMQNGTRKGFAMKIKTRLLGFKMVRFNMGAQGILIPRSVNNELEGKVDSIGDEDPAKNKSILNKGPKWKTAVTSVKKWYVLFILLFYVLIN